MQDLLPRAIKRCSAQFSQLGVKNLADADKYGNWFSKIYIKELVFTLKLCHLKEFDDYIILHKLRILHTFIVTLCTVATREVVSISLKSVQQHFNFYYCTWHT